MGRTLRDEIGKRKPFDLVEEEASLNILRTAGVLECEFSRMFKQRGLSGSAYNVLRILRGEAEGGMKAGVPMQVVGDRLVARVPDVTRLVDRLEKGGLVERSRTREDRRVVLVSITKKGLALLAQLDGPVRDLNTRLLSHLSASELKELIRLLEKARESACL